MADTIFVDISHFPQFAVATVRLLFIDREYDSIFEIDQQNFSDRFY